uniref:Uncharacterized protein n=1 Tax=viral metagenome TaxID=1070528 RepID=A0A6C0LT21_9ZZZZ
MFPDKIYINEYINTSTILDINLKNKINEKEQVIRKIITNQKNKYSDKKILFYHGKQTKYFFLNIFLNVLKKYNLLNKFKQNDSNGFDYFNNMIKGKYIDRDYRLTEYISMNLFLEPIISGESCLIYWLLNQNAPSFTDKTTNGPSIFKDPMEIIIEKICETLYLNHDKLKIYWNDFNKEIANITSGILEIYEIPIEVVNKYFKLYYAMGNTLSIENNNVIINNHYNDCVNNYLGSTIQVRTLFYDLINNIDVIINVIHDVNDEIYNKYSSLIEILIKETHCEINKLNDIELFKNF